MPDAPHQANLMLRTIKRHPALAYFVLTFAISWGGILWVVGPGNVLASKEEFESFRWVPPLVLGPTIAGLLTTWLVAGKQGLRDYRSRLLRWRVGARWYAVALLAAPIYYATTALALSGFSREYLPAIVTADDKAALLVQSMVVALSAGIFEELGWTGFAVPTLRRRYGSLATGLIVGIVWGVWHILPETLGATAYGLLPYLAVQLVAVIVGLTGFRILMVWIYDRTGSVLIGILMHAGLTASLLLLQPLVTGMSLMTVGLILDAVPWLIVAIVVVGPSLVHPRQTTRPAHESLGA